MAFVPTSGFCGAAVRQSNAVCSGPSTKTVMKMSAEEGFSRRELLLGALAAMVPASALAKSGDSPRQSFFGGGSSSSPFLYSDKKKGAVLYKELNDEEVAFITNSLKDNRSHLANTDQYIAIPSWDDIRSEIRLQMYSARRNMLKINGALADKKQADRAGEAYQTFKKNIEDLDYAASLKDQARAKKSRAASLKSFDNWASVAGIDL